jgi:translin
MNNRLDMIADQIRTSFSNRDTVREKVLPLCRDAIRCCSQSIRAVHRQEFERARELLVSARGLIDNAVAEASTCEDFGLGGYIRDAQKEYAEASLTLAIVTRQELPAPADLRVADSSYLNGMGEAAGELRRYLLDSMRRGDISRGDELLSAMDDFYSVMVTMDFPDAITGSLRRTTDMVRGVLEKTRSDLALVVTQDNLRQRLNELESKLQPPGR